MKLKITAGTSVYKSESSRIVDVPDEDLKDMDEEQRRAYFDKIAEDELFNLVDYGWEIVKDKE